MGARGELFTTQIYLDNRSYFFNVKENRTGDVFLQIVESKNRDGVEADRHQIAIFAEDMQKFLQGFEKSLDFVEIYPENGTLQTASHVGCWLALYFLNGVAERKIKMKNQ